MKKGYNSSDLSKQEGQDQARRLYRIITDNARRLDDARGCAKSVSDLFTPILLAQRSKLRENCERLIFLDPLLYGHKGEELLWKRVYYDVVSTSKRLKKHEYSLEDVSHLQCHINAGIGYYHHFITRLQIDFDLNLNGIVDLPLTLHEQPVKQLRHDDELNSNKKLTEWAELAVHRCLIYLGDLNRYKLELHPNWDHGLAVRYYMQASSYKPDYGMPHNQLGTLASASNYWLDAVYHYMRCLCCKHTFDGTENNLIRLMEKNARNCEKYQNDIDPTEHIKRFTTRFLTMIDVLYFEKKYSRNIHILCHEILFDLKACLSYTKPLSSDHTDSLTGSGSNFETDSDLLSCPNYLNSETVFKMIIICLICIAKLQKIDSMQISFVKAFLLAIYSQLIQNIIEHIEDSVFNHTISSPKSSVNGIKLAKKKNKKRITKLRRRRLAPCSDDSDLSESECTPLTSSDSNNSDDETDNESRASSTTDNDNEYDDEEENHVDIKSDSDKVSQADSLKKSKRMNPIDLLEIVADEGLLQCIKVLCDWLTSDIIVLKECGSSSQILLTKIVHLLNLININLNSKKLKTFKEKFDRIVNNAGGDFAKIPLPEDIILKGMGMFKLIQNKIDWKQLNNVLIEPKEEALFRVQKLIAFGHFLADVKETGVSYNTKKKLFEIDETVFQEMEHASIQNGEITDTKNDIASRGKLMQHMGQLWLESEVRNLETRVRGRTAFSPYLVLDVDALIHYTHLAKQLVATRKFIVLVPIIVLSALDELKRETIKARDAIRWLEAQFHHGNRFLRAQRPQERASIPLIKYPKKKDKETYTFIQVIECCYFLAQQQKTDDANLVTLLTGNQHLNHVTNNHNNHTSSNGTTSNNNNNNNNSSSNNNNNNNSSEFSFKGLAQSAGVHFELITAFHQKWKKSMRNNGHNNHTNYNNHSNNNNR